MSNKEPNNKINKELKTILSDYRILAGEKDTYKPTHTSLFCDNHGSGSYFVPSDINNELYDIIYNHAFLKKKSMSLTESHDGIKFSPLIDDVDTRDPYNQNLNMDRKYSDEDIREYCSHLIESLEKYCDLSDKQRLMFIFQKSKPALDNKSKMVKDGWHIMMPYLVAPYELFYVARQDRITNGNLKSLFSNLGYTNELEDIIDKSVIEQNNWFMYGSSKPNKEAYKLTKIYKVSNGNVLEISRKNLDLVSDRKLVELFSVRNKTLNVKYKDDIDIKKIYNILPPGQKNAKDAKGTMNKKEINKQNRRRPRNMIMNKTSHNIEIIKKYVKCLKPHRAESYHDWIRVGWCLHNIDFSLLESWDEFSKQSAKYVPGECQNIWYTMKDEGLGLGTLRMWARNDNPKMYEQIKREDIENILLLCVYKGHTNISEYIKAKYSDEFICAGITNKEWYQYTGHRWKYIEDGWTLRDKVARDIGYDFQYYASECFKKAINTQGYGYGKKNATPDDASNIEGLNRRFKQFSELAQQIGNTNILNNIMNECKFRFYDEEFRKKLDENDSLIHFTNGVYDLDKDEFREGYPEDYISLSTNLEYVEDPDEYDYEILNDINTFFEQVLPIEAVREYALTLMGSFLSGKNKEQKFYIWTGSGSNGKSMTVDLFQDCLGDYSGTISVAIFTKGRLDANAPSPAVAKLKGKRFISLQEPEGDDKLNMGIIKQWVGGDAVQARELNKAPIEFVMKAKFVLVCNDLPTIDSLDGGTWRRIRLLEYLSKFVDKPKKSNEFKIDKNLKDKMTQWHNMFMWLLIEYHKRYKKNGIHEPPAVTRVTDEYKENSDFYSQFFNEHIERDLNSKISIKDTYAYFRNWHKTTYEGKKLVLKQNFEKHMSMLMGIPNGSFWNGWQYVSSEDKEDKENKEHEPQPNQMIDSDNEQPEINIENNDLYNNKIEYDYEIVKESDIESESDSNNESDNDESDIESESDSEIDEVEQQRINELKSLLKKQEEKRQNKLKNNKEIKIIDKKIIKSAKPKTH